MSYIGDSSLHQDDFLEGKGYSKEWGETLIQFVSHSPTPLMLILCSNLIALSGGYHCLLEHLIDDVVILNPNGGGAFDEGENDLQGSNLSLVHEANQLSG